MNLYARCALLALALTGASAHAYDARCGRTVRQSVTLMGDLDCEGFTGAAVIMEGDHLTFDGNGFKIIGRTLKGAIVGSGRNMTVKNTVMENYKDGTAIFLTDAPGLRIQNNFIENNRIGITLYAGMKEMTDVQVTNNVITNSGEYGLILRRYRSYTVLDPRIEGNDFSGSKSAAIEAATEALSISGSQNNIFNDCRNGIVFYGGMLVVEGLDLSQSRIPSTPLTVAEARNVQIFNSNFSSTPGTVQPPTFRGTTTGISSSGVDNLTIQNTVISGREIAIILTQHGPQSGAARIENNVFAGNVAGLHVRSEDGTSWGVLKVTGNDLRVREAQQALWFLPGVTYAAGSDFSNNLLTGAPRLH